MHQFLRFWDLKNKGIPFTRKHVFHLCKHGRFPQPVRIGAGDTGSIAWLESEIDGWLAERIQNRDAVPISVPTQRYPDDATIRLLVAGNPKRGAARDRFALYRDGMTVSEAKQAGVLGIDLSWDRRKGFIAIESPGERSAAK